MFCDERAQSVLLREAQHAVRQGLLAADAITPLGDVITGRHPDRERDADITLFDGTGGGLQDLAVAARVVARARQRG